jgi:hypothetical protein
MTTASLVLAASLAGVQWGYQPADGGGLEYIIHIEPELVSSLTGDGITSEIKGDLQNVRRYRIVVSSESPPRIDLPAAPAEVPGPAIRPPSQEAKPTFQPIPGKAADPPEPSLSLPLPPTDVARRPGELGSGATTEAPPWNQPKPATSAPPFEQPKVEPPAVEAKSPPGDGRYPSMSDRYQAPPILNADPASAELPVAPQLDEVDVFKPATPPAKAPDAVPADPARPWIPFALSLLALVGSLGANVYLVWTWLGTRRRYLDLVHVRTAG